MTVAIYRSVQNINRYIRWLGIYVVFKFLLRYFGATTMDSLEWRHFMYALNSKVLLLSAPLVKRESCTLSYYVYIDIHSLYISPFLLLLFPADLTTQNDLFSSRSWACDASYVSACAPRENARRSINTAGGASKSSTVDVCHLIFECAHTRRHTPWRNPAATILFVDRYSLGCGRDRALVSGSATNEGGR